MSIDDETEASLSPELRKLLGLRVWKALGAVSTHRREIWCIAATHVSDSCPLPKTRRPTPTSQPAGRCDVAETQNEACRLVRSRRSTSTYVQ